MILWTEQYRLGVELIDKQHKELFAVINRILKILDDGDMERNRRACVEAVKYLKNYVVRHFADEEAYQREIGYADYEGHKLQHEAFTQRVGELEKDMEANGYSRDSVRRFMDALTAWLLNHIMKADQAITAGK